MEEASAESLTADQLSEQAKSDKEFETVEEDGTEHFFNALDVKWWNANYVIALGKYQLY